jgi:hypothetical protein
LNLKSDGCAVNASRAQSSSLQLPGIRLRARPIKNLQDGPELVPRISPRTVSAISRALAPKSRQSASFAIRERMMNLLTEVICRHLDHRWGEWQYETEGSCEQHQTCLRCQFVRRRFAAHQLSEPQYARPNSCERRRSCARCSYTERVETAHQWGADRQTSECTTVKICSRCFTCSKPTSIDHRWGPWVSREPGPWMRYRECTRCGETDFELLANPRLDRPVDRRNDDLT